MVSFKPHATPIASPFKPSASTIGIDLTFCRHCFLEPFDMYPHTIVVIHACQTRRGGSDITVFDKGHPRH